MTLDETLAALLVLRNRVPAEQVFPDHAMALAWHADLNRYPSEAAQRAAEAWEEKRFPSAGEFLPAVQAATRALAVESNAQHQERMLAYPGGKPCDCEGGWVRLSYAGQGTVRRCTKCGPPVIPADQHKRSCTCMTCHYGIQGADEIRRGYQVPPQAGVVFTRDEF